MIEHLRRLFKHSFNYTLSGGLAGGVSLVLLPLLTRTLGPAGYGAVTTYAALFALLTVFFLLNQHVAVTRFYFDYREAPERLRGYVGTILKFLIVWGGVLLALLIGALSRPLGRFVGLPVTPFVTVAVVAAFLRGFTLVHLALLRAAERSLAYLGLQAAYAALELLLVMLFVVAWRAGAEGRVWAHLVAVGAIAALSLGAMRRLATWGTQPRGLADSLGFGVPLMAHTLSKQTIAVNDRILLSHFRGLAETGVYGAAAALAGGFSVLLVGINDAWAPFLFDTAQRHGEASKAIFARLTSYYVALVVSCALVLSLFGRELLALLAGGAYDAAHTIVPLLVAGWLARGFYYMVVNQVFYAKKTRWIALGSVAGAVVTVGLSWVFIPRWGMVGAAAATLLASVVLFLITFALAQHLFPIGYEGRMLIPVGAGFLVMTASALLDLAAESGAGLGLLGLKVALLTGYAALVAQAFFTRGERASVRRWVHDGVLRTWRAARVGGWG